MSRLAPCIEPQDLGIAQSEQSHKGALEVVVLEASGIQVRLKANHHQR